MVSICYGSLIFPLLPVLKIYHYHTLKNIFILHTGGNTYPGYPNLAFEFRSGLDQARFIMGVLASKQKAVSKVCMMVPLGFPLMARFANYALLGMRYVNNVDTLHLGLTLNFDDPESETNVANYFLSIGCDVTMLQSMNTIHALLIIAAGGKYGMGTASDMRDFVGESVLTSIILDSSVPFVYYVNKVLAGTFVSELYNYTLENGSLRLADYSCDVTKEARKEANKVETQLMAGTLDMLCQPYIKKTFGVDCIDATQIAAELFPDITIYDGTAGGTV